MNSKTFLLAQVSFFSSIGVLLTLLALHVLSPEFDPSWRMVSEYANGGYSWVLSLMFLCWAVSSWALAAGLRSQVQSRWQRIGLWLLVSSGVGEAMAAVFTINHPLHSVASFIGIGSFPFAALLLSYGLGKQKSWTSFSPVLKSLAHLSWIMVIAMIGSFVLLITTYMNAGGDLSAGPTTQIPDGVIAIVGWANRLLILVYVAWLSVAAWAVQKTKISDK